MGGGGIYSIPAYKTGREKNYASEKRRTGKESPSSRLNVLFRMTRMVGPRSVGLTKSHHVTEGREKLGEERPTILIR